MNTISEGDHILRISNAAELVLTCEECISETRHGWNRSELAKDAYRHGWRIQDDALYCPSCADDEGQT